MGRYSDQMLLPYNGAPGFKEKTTSRDTAYAIAPAAEILREKIYKAIKAAGAYGATADESAVAVGTTPLAARPRLSELRNMNMIKPSIENKHRPSSTGRSSIVWIVT